MKNFILTLILLSPFSTLTGMEQPDEKKQSSVTIVCANEQLTIDTKTFENLESISKTIKDMTENCSSNKKIDISCTEITIEILRKIISYLPKHPVHTENGLVYSESEKKDLIEKLMSENIKTLALLLKNCNELDISILMNLLTKVLAEKFIQYDELERFLNNPYYIGQLGLPEELSKKITTEIIKPLSTSSIVYWSLGNTTSTSLEQTLLVTRCLKDRVSLKKHSNLYLHFIELSKQIQNELFIQNKIEVSLIQILLLFYNITKKEKIENCLSINITSEHFSSSISYRKVLKKITDYRPNYKPKDWVCTEDAQQRLANKHTKTLVSLLNDAKYLDIATLEKLLTETLARKLMRNKELENFVNKVDYIKKLGLSKQSNVNIAIKVINNLINNFRDHDHLATFTSKQALEQALLLKACDNDNIVSLKEHPYLYDYFKQLPEIIQKSLIEKDMVELSFLQILNYHNQTIMQIAVASTATIITLCNILKEK